MEFNRKVADDLIADTDEFIVYWDYEKGWSCSETGCETLVREPIREKGMLGLLDIVQDDDRELCSLFLNIMQQGSKDADQFQPLVGKRKEVNLHLRNVDGTYQYYRVVYRIGILIDCCNVIFSVHSIFLLV